MAAENVINGNIHEAIRRNVLLMPENIKIQRIFSIQEGFSFNILGAHYCCPQILAVVY